MTQGHWCKVASNLDSHPKIRKGGRNAREVFLFALRRNADPTNPVPGYLPEGILDPWFIADQLMMTEAEAADGIARAESAQLIAREGRGWRIIGWEDEWGKRPATGAERTRKWREGLSPKPTSQDVTPITSDDSVTSQTSPNVTVTDRDALDQIRSEEKRSEIPPLSPLSGGDLPKADPKHSAELREKCDRYAGDVGKQRARAQRLPDDWKPERSEVNRAIEQEAIDVGISPARELDRMRDWEKAGGKTAKDWNSRWRNWLRKAIDDHRSRRGAQQSTQIRHIERLDGGLP